MSASTIALAVALLCCGAPAACAQAEPAAPAPSAEEPAAATPGAAKLAQEFNDPLTTLPQVFRHDSYTPSNYGTEAETNQLTARLIVPRIPELALFPFVQLIRPRPGKGSGLLMGVGPVFVFPTATDELAGQGAWQVGPAFGAIYKGIPGLLLGGLAKNPISFAYTSSDRPSVSTPLVRPVLTKQI